MMHSNLCECYVTHSVIFTILSLIAVYFVQEILHSLILDCVNMNVGWTVEINLPWTLSGAVGITGARNDRLSWLTMWWVD